MIIIIIIFITFIVIITIINTILIVIITIIIIIIIIIIILGSVTHAGAQKLISCLDATIKLFDSAESNIDKYSSAELFVY